MTTIVKIVILYLCLFQLQVFAISTDRVEIDTMVKVMGEINSPGKYAIQETDTFSDILIGKAGGFTDHALHWRIRCVKKNSLKEYVSFVVNFNEKRNSRIYSYVDEGESFVAIYIPSRH